MRRRAQALSLILWLLAAGVVVATSPGCKKKKPGEASKTSRDKNERACAQGNLEDCHALGEMYRIGREGTRCMVAARNLYERGCSLRSPEACYNDAMTLLTGDGGEKDEPTARLLFSRICLAGDPASCNNFGLMALNGVGGKKAPFEATCGIVRCPILRNLSSACILHLGPEQG